LLADMLALAALTAFVDYVTPWVTIIGTETVRITIVKIETCTQVE